MQHRCEWGPGSLIHYREFWKGLFSSTPTCYTSCLSNPCLPGAFLWFGMREVLGSAHSYCFTPLPSPFPYPDRFYHQARTWCQALKNRRLTWESCSQGAYSFGRGEKGRSTQNQPWFSIVSSPVEFLIKCHGNLETRGAEKEDNACEPRGRSGICDWREGILGCRNIQGAWRVPWFIRKVT